MILGKKIVAIIPARGGSKEVKKKNIKPLGGRPLIVHTIETALAVSGIDFCAVSSEDNDIQCVARDRGANVINRPENLALDHSPTEDVLLHALDSLEHTGEVFDYVVVLEPTSPFRSISTIVNAVEHIIRKKGESLLAVREIKEVVGTIEEGVFKTLFPNEPRRRQDRKPRYLEASTIYVAEVSYLRQSKTLRSDNWLAFLVPQTEAFDINTIDDFTQAEAIIAIKEKKNEQHY